MQKVNWYKSGDWNGLAGSYRAVGKTNSNEKKPIGYILTWREPISMITLENLHIAHPTDSWHWDPAHYGPADMQMVQMPL
jgi:hypothetical protein